MGYGLTSRRKRRFKLWFFEGLRETGVMMAAHHQAPWWKVMCLTGVDYFSTLGYQPGIAFLAAGLLSPVATLILVLLTLFGALPIYNRVAEASPNGQGSIAMLEDLLPRWKGKAVVLCLLGFAATDFVITITLSAADATAHIVGNPFVPETFNHPIALTLILLAALAAVFLKGFKEAIDFAVVIVGIYLVLNVVVIGYALAHVFQHPGVLPAWRDALFSQQGSPLMMVALALLLFPKLALGLSGFETGVAVMPLVKGDPTDTPEHPVGRIRNTKKLLRTAALLMSVFLIGSSLSTTLLIPPAEFREGGQAWGRALAYLAHLYLGEVFGTIYDVSTISILWFAGASAMAGLLNLVPRYLPRYGMAPEWTKATRPLVLLFTAITFLITILFKANVEAQGGAYATGVLVLMTSAAVAVTLHLRRSRFAFGFGTIAAGVRLHDGREHLRAAGRHQDRVVVHRHHHRDVADLARAPIDGAAHSGRGAGCDGGGLPSRSRPSPGAAHCQPAGCGDRRSTSTSCGRRASRITFRSTSRCCFSKCVPATCPTSAERCRSRERMSPGTTYFGV